MNIVIKHFGMAVCAMLLSAAAGASAAEIKYHGGGNYTLVERTDLRRYDNGRYTGLVSREVRSFITRTHAPDALSPQMKDSDAFYDGDFYVKEETMRGRHKAAGGINTSIPSSFRITDKGELLMMTDNGYPSFRSFPAYAPSPVNIGDKWRAEAVRAVDPLGKDIITKMPMHVEYTYIGNDKWNGEEVFVLSAKWATRYGGTHGGGEYGGRIDPKGDSALLRAEGSHDATMLISRRTGAALVVRDRVDETFIYDGGQAVSFKGSISLFTEYPPAAGRESIIPALQRAGIASYKGKDGTPTPTGGGKDIRDDLSDDGTEVAMAEAVPKDDAGEMADGQSGMDITKNKEDGSTESGAKEKESLARAVSASLAQNTSDEDDSGRGSAPPIKVEDTDSGLRLTMENLRFLPDSAELLPSERGRVQTIASVLREANGSMFLVEGHTASTNNPRGEMRLSAERARAVAQALSAYGIDESRFICKGSGALKPVAPNNTSSGKAQNRRVEITILE